MAVSPLMGAYRVAWAPAVLWGAAPVPVAVAFIASRYYKVRSVASLAVSVVVLVAAALAICGGNVVALRDVLSSGPRNLLTETLPLVGSIRTLVPLLVVEWMSAALTAEIVARTLPIPDASFARLGESPSRLVPRFTSHRGVLALTIPLAVYIGSISAASALPSQSQASGPELLVVIATAAAVLHGIVDSEVLVSSGSLGGDSGRRELSERPGAYQVEPSVSGENAGAGLATHFGPLARATAVSVLVASVLALAVPASLSGSGKPVVLHLQAQVVTPVINDPVDELAQLRDDNGERPVSLGSVTLPGSQTQYLQAAVLDDYNGGLWSFRATFVPTGGRIPDLSPTGGRTRVIGQIFNLAASWPISLLPAVGRPSQISGVQVDADGTTGMILKDGGGPGARYVVRSRTSTLTFAQLPSGSQIDLQAGDTTDIELPEGAQSYLSATVGFLSYLTGMRPSPTVDFLEAALRGLRADDKWIDPSLSSSPPLGGTSLAQVINAVTVDRAATPEQFATFFAVAARLLGVPSRVVTGMRLTASERSEASSSATFKLNSAEIWTWVEIPVVGRGWLLADPTPTTATAAGSPAPQPARTAPTTVASPVAVAAPGPASGEQHAVAPPAPTSSIPKRGSSGWAVAAVITLLLVVVAAGLLPSLKRRARRRRRVCADPPGQVVGAWCEILERAERFGVRLPEASTNAEVAAELAGVYGPAVLESAGRVALLAERVVFNPSAPVGQDDIDELWQAESDVRAAIRVDLRQLVGLRVRWIRSMAAMVGLGRSKGSGRS
ncbi:MAG: transglutaminase domain-containing protein [Acidimicrobiales bacterium]